MMEFTANNHINRSTKITSFFADYGFQLRIGIKLFNIYNNEQKVKLLATNQIVEKQNKIIKFLQDQII